jgi:hypothetical protein
MRLAADPKGRGSCHPSSSSGQCAQHHVLGDFQPGRSGIAVCGNGSHVCEITGPGRCTKPLPRFDLKKRLTASVTSENSGVSGTQAQARGIYSWTTTVPSDAWRALAPPNQQVLLDLFPLPNGPPLNSFGIGELIGSSVPRNACWSVNGRLDHALTSHTRTFLRADLTPSWSDSGLT